MRKQIHILIGALTLAFTLGGFAQQAEAQTGRGVVRPALFTKAKRIEISPFFGYVSNDPWTTGYIPGASVVYHLSDRTALDFTAGYGLYSNKTLVDQVIQETGNPPTLISRPSYFVTANYAWSPLYGKLNLLGEVVVHYDLFLVGGVGVAGDEIEVNKRTGGTVEQSISTQIFPVVDFGVGQRFFLNNWFAVRLDVRPYVFLEFIDGQLDPNGDVQVAFGLSFLL
jgi:outer membrane beta-barrel protein